MDKPFQCERCKNWYIGVPVKDGNGNVLNKDEQECRMCAEGTHAAHPKTGVVDCHWGQASPTPSEISMAKIHRTILMASTSVEKAIGSIGKVATRQEADSLLDTCEAHVSQAIQAEQGVALAMKFAGAFEMPGLPKDGPLKTRYRTVEQMEELTSTNRRPLSDLYELQRSEKVCAELKADIEKDMGRTKVLIQQLREKAMNFKEKVPAGTK